MATKKQDVLALLDKAVGKKGPLRIPAYWMREVLLKIMDWAEGLTPEVDVPTKISQLENDVVMATQSYVNARIHDVYTKIDDVQNSLTTVGVYNDKDQYTIPIKSTEGISYNPYFYLGNKPIRFNFPDNTSSYRGQQYIHFKPILHLNMELGNYNVLLGDNDVDVWSICKFTITRLGYGCNIIQYEKIPTSMVRLFNEKTTSSTLLGSNWTNKLGVREVFSSSSIDNQNFYRPEFTSTRFVYANEVYIYEIGSILNNCKECYFDCAEILEGVEWLGSECFTNARTRKYIFPSTFKGFIDGAFNGVGVDLLDFRKSKVVPAFDTTNSTVNFNMSGHIVVPDELYDEWINSTDWSSNTLKKIIIKASEYAE